MEKDLIDEIDYKSDGTGEFIAIDVKKKKVIAVAPTLGDTNDSKGLITLCGDREYIIHKFEPTVSEVRSKTKIEAKLLL